MLNPQWLRTFVKVAELGSFTRAAEQLDLTQAAVSQHIGHLEDQLGPLLIRRPRALELTPAGHALGDYCAELAQADERLQARLSDPNDASGEISLATPGSVGLAIYPLLLDLQQENRGLAIRHRFAPDPEVREAVLANRCELGIVTLKPDDPRLAARLLAEEPLELVVPATETVEGWDDLARIGFIDHPDGQAMATRLLSRTWPDNPGIKRLPCSGFVNQIGLILAPVARGLGFTVIPRHARLAFADAGAIRVIAQAAPVRDGLWLIHRAEWSLSARAARAVDYLAARMDNLGRETA